MERCELLCCMCHISQDAHGRSPAVRCVGEVDETVDGDHQICLPDDERRHQQASRDGKPRSELRMAAFERLQDVTCRSRQGQIGRRVDDHQIVRVNLRLRDHEEQKRRHQPEQQQAIAPGQSLVMPALDPPQSDVGNCQNDQPFFQAIEAIGSIDQAGHVGLVGLSACQGMDVTAADGHQCQVRRLAEETIG